MRMKGFNARLQDHARQHGRGCGGGDGCDARNVIVGFGGNRTIHMTNNF